MAPAAQKRVTKARQPLATSKAPTDPTQSLPSMAEIFNSSQHVTTSDLALNQLKNLYKVTSYKEFDKQFRVCIRKLCQSKQTIYFKTSCDFLCKFLQHLSKLSDEIKTKNLRTVITNHDRIVSTCMDVADQYMTLQDDDCRLNAVTIVDKLIHHMDTLDEEICQRLKDSLPERVRDKKPIIRTKAILASRTFQDSAKIRKAFMYHFQWDPELIVRKALIHVMDTKIFGYDFLINSTQDNVESMRKTAFQRLGKINPKELNAKQLHRVIHNGLNERDRQASYTFKAHTLEPWISILYDGIDLYKLLESFDILNNHEIVCQLLNSIYERDLQDLQNNSTTTKLHQVVEAFRDKWLSTDNLCLPVLSSLDENIITIWFTLVKYCKTNQALIKPIKVRTLKPQADDVSIVTILHSEERDEELVDLYERLTPDLVNLVSFLGRFVHHANQALKSMDTDVNKLEFIYHQIMLFISRYEIGDESERKTVQEVFDNILKENLLTGKFEDFMTPIIKCLHDLIYSSSPNLMMNYTSELINNVISHQEDLVTSARSLQSPILPRSSSPRAVKRVRISTATDERNAPLVAQDKVNIDHKIADIKVEISELNDELENCIQNENYTGAKVIEDKLSYLRAHLTMLRDRRYSSAASVSHLSMIIETEPLCNDKLSSTMIDGTSFNASTSSPTGHQDIKYEIIFRHYPNELLKCLQMYQSCMQNVKISNVPETMLNHLAYLTYQCLDQCFKNNTRVRSLMVACHGLTALVDKKYALDETTILLLIGATYDIDCIELRTVGFKSLVDIICEHDDLKVSMEQVEKFMKNSLRDYDRYASDDLSKRDLNYATAIVVGSAKLLYFKKLSSPDILSHLILWWYHPNTHSKLKQFIGIFLPTFVGDVLIKQRSAEDSWLEDLLKSTFVCSVKHLHSYILVSKVMSQGDIHSLINFLCNLIPTSMHQRVMDEVEEQIEEMRNRPAKGNQDLIKYLEKSKNNLSSSIEKTNNDQTALGIAPIQHDE